MIVIDENRGKGKTCIECTSKENYSYLTTEID
jgi:hypothetical protein